MSGSDLVRRASANARAASETRARIQSKSWDTLRGLAKAAASQSSWNEVIEAYERLTGVVFDSLDQSFQLGARSVPRSQLGEILVGERGIPAATWERANRLLEYAETVRFAASAGAISQQDARKELAKWVSEGQSVCKALEHHSKK